MGFLSNKRALIVGIANNRSIAYGIAKSLHREGAELAFTYQGERLQDRIINMANNEFNTKLCFPCDLGSDEQIATVFQELAKNWDGLDIVIHSAAFAPSDQLEGNFIDSVTRDGFKIANDISSYSFVALAKAARPLMKNRKGALLALSHLGSNRTFPNYNVMGAAKASLEANMRYLAASLGPEGTRVNVISAGPIRTLAASAVKDMRKLLSFNAKVSPLRGNVTIEQVGDTAAFLCSDLASGITGQVLYVDAGFNIVCISEEQFNELAD
jgi:enoyl-[acyl-carrier protein] reductase I